MITTSARHVEPDQDATRILATVRPGPVLHVLQDGREIAPLP